MDRMTLWTTACALGCAVSSHAIAGFTPGGVSFAVTSSAGSANASFSGAQISSDSWSWTGNWAANGASVSWNAVPATWNGTTMSLGGNFVIRNSTASTQFFLIDISLPGSFSAGTEWRVGGSAALSMVNLSPDVGRLFAQGPLWSAVFDSTTVGSLFSNASATVDPFFAATLPSQSFGNPIPGQTFFGGVSSAARIRVGLNMTAGMEATITSAFAAQFIPAPGAMAVLGLATFAGSRRRRR